MNKKKNKLDEHKFLPIIALGSEDILPTKKSIEQLIEGNKGINRKIIDDYFRWSKSENELIAYCGYGHSDIIIPKTYNCLFDSDKINQPIKVQATVQFSIWNGLLPIESIELGHKTICIISFKDKIPSELHHLPLWTDFQKGNYQYDKFGLCDINDFDSVNSKEKNG